MVAWINQGQNLGFVRQVTLGVNYSLSNIKENISKPLYQEKLIKISFKISFTAFLANNDINKESLVTDCSYDGHLVV